MVYSLVVVWGFVFFFLFTSFGGIQKMDSREKSTQFCTYYLPAIHYSWHLSTWQAKQILLPNAPVKSYVSVL